MPVRCREEAEKILGPHFDDFASIVVESVRFYYEFYGERAHAHESWTRCSIIRDENKERLLAYCETTNGFQPVRDGNATYFGAYSKVHAADQKTLRRPPRQYGQDANLF